MTPGRGPDKPTSRTPDEGLRIFVSSTLLVSIGLDHDEGIAYIVERLCASAADVPEFVFNEGCVERLRLRTPATSSRLDARDSISG